MEIKRVGSQSSVKGPADWFTGMVRIDPLFEAAAEAGRDEPVGGEEGAERRGWQRGSRRSVRLKRRQSRTSSAARRPVSAGASNSALSAPKTPPTADTRAKRRLPAVSRARTKRFNAVKHPKMQTKPARKTRRRGRSRCSRDWCRPARRRRPRGRCL